MAEYINKAELIHNLLGLPEYGFDVYEAITKVPTIDIVHCSECMWWERNEDTKYGFCHACQHGYLSDRWDISIHRKTEEDHYCADGERENG